MQENSPGESSGQPHSQPHGKPPNDGCPQNPTQRLESRQESLQTHEQKSVVLHALTMALGTMTSRTLGLVRESAFAALFDKNITDAFGVAFRLPNLFRRLLGEGSLSVSFIPVFVEAHLGDLEHCAQKHSDPNHQEKQQYRSKNLVNSFYTILLIFLASLTTLGIVFAEPVLRAWLNSNFLEDAERFALTLRMTQIMFGFIFFVSTYAYFMGILNALGSYGLAAVAPTLWNVAMIVATLIPVHWFSSPGDGLAFGVLIGGALQMGVLIPRLIKMGFMPKLSLSLFTDDVLKVLRNMVPGLVGMGLLQFTTLVNLNFLSRLAEGSISYVNYVDRLIELPLSLISVSLGTALLPTLSAMWARGEVRKLSETAHFYLRLNLFTSIPAAFGLIALAYPIVELLFVRGRFSQADGMVTAGVLSAYAWVMIFSSSVRVLTPSYYAIKNTWYPAVVSGVCLTIHVFLAPVLMNRYGLNGLMASTVTSAALNFLLLIFAFPFLVTSFHYLSFLWQVLKFFILGGALFFTCRELYPIARDLMGASFIGKISSLAMTILVGALLYIFLAKMTKLEEFESVFGTFVGRAKNKMSRVFGRH